MRLPRGDEYTRLRKAFSNLSENLSFTEIIEYLKKRKEEDLESLSIQTDDLQLRWLQGEIQLITEIMRLYNP